MSVYLGASMRLRERWIVVGLTAWMVLLVGVVAMVYSRYAGLRYADAAKLEQLKQESAEIDRQREVIERAVAQLQMVRSAATRANSAGREVEAWEKEVAALKTVERDLAAATQAAEKRRVESAESMANLERAEKTVEMQNEQMRRQLEAARAEIVRLEAQARERRAGR